MSNNKDFKVKNGIQPTVYHEGLGTVVSGSEAYSLAGASYDSVSLDVSGQTILPLDVFFKPDGTKMFTTGASGSTYTINEYTLSTAYDISSASFTQSFSTASQETGPRAVWFKPDGTKMFLLGATGDDVNEYTLSTAWSLTSVSFVDSFSVASQDTAPTGLTFSADGTEMYTLGLVQDDVIQYTLGTAWDVSTASYTRNLVITTVEPNPRDVQFNSDGTVMFISGKTNGLHKYTLTTGYDISTATLDSSSTITSTTQPEPWGFFVKSDGTKVWVGDGTNKVIYQYSTALNTATLDLSTGSVFEVTPTSDIQVTLSNPADSGTVSGATLLLDGGGSAGYDLSNGSYSGKSFDVSSQDTSPLGLAFNDTGTKLYVAGSANDSIFQYSLSTAYDISTASYDSVSFSVASQAAGVQAVSFKSDGTKMYVLDDTPNDSVHQYSLSTAYDLSTASYDSVSFSVATQESGPLGLFIKPDGTKFYVCGTGNDTVFQYSMSTAWDMSTASYDSVSFSVASQDTRPNGIFFNPTGDTMLISGQGSDAIFEYSLSTAWNVSTASYTSTSLDVTGEALNPQDLVMSSDGKKLFVVTSETDSIYQYSTATPATITYDTAIEWPSGTAPTSPAIGETDIIAFNTRDGGITYSGVLAIDGAK